MSVSQGLTELEKRHVEEVYNEIAPHFTDITHTAWPKVKHFLKGLPPGALVADIGCGNGRYLKVNKRLWNLGSDRCEGLVKIAQERGHEVMVADNLHLPYRDGVFDAVISIAVIHHFASVDRRIQAIKELSRILSPGGRIMICVWAFEQKHRRFDSQDVLVPWNKPKQRRRSKLNRSSLGTSSEFSSTSSISEDDTSLDLVETKMNESSKNVNGEKSLSGDKMAGISSYKKMTNGDKLSMNILANDNSKSLACTKPLSPVRPCTLRLRHRHTAHVVGQSGVAKQFNKRENIGKSSSTHQNLPISSKTSKTNYSLRCKTRSYSKKHSKQKDIRSSTFDPFPSSSSSSSLESLSIKSYSYKAGVSPVLTKPNVVSTAKQTPSILHKLKSLFSSKTKGESSKEKAIQCEMSWCEYYSQCASQLEEDLSSFTSFCKLVSSDDGSKNLAQEFIVREFPQSSQQYSCNTSSKANNENHQSICKINKKSLESQPFQSAHCVENGAQIILPSNDIIVPCNEMPFKDQKTSSPQIKRCHKGSQLFNHFEQNPPCLHVLPSNDAYVCPDHTISTVLPTSAPSSQPLTVLSPPSCVCSLPSVQTNIESDLPSGQKARLSSQQPSVQSNDYPSQSDLICKLHSDQPTQPLNQVNGSPPLPSDCLALSLRQSTENNVHLSTNDVRDSENVKENSKCLQRLNGLRLSSKIKKGHIPEGGMNGCEKPKLLVDQKDSDEVFEVLASSLSSCFTNLESAPVKGENSRITSWQRYYHVFKEGELEQLINAHIPDLKIVHSYFDHANWCVIAEKL